jgi:hypothetical protein
MRRMNLMCVLTQVDSGTVAHHWDWLAILGVVLAVITAGCATWLTKHESDETKQADSGSKRRAPLHWLYVANIVLAVLTAAVAGLAGIKSGLDIDRANQRIESLVKNEQLELSTTIQNQSVGSPNLILVQPTVTTFMPQKRQSFGIFVLNGDRKAPVYDFTAEVVTIDPNENQQPPTVPHAKVDFGTIGPGQRKLIFSEDVSGKSHCYYFLSATFRNGTFFEKMSFRQVAGRWQRAIGRSGKLNEALVTQTEIDPDFPKDTQGAPAW